MSPIFDPGAPNDLHEFEEFKEFGMDYESLLLRPMLDLQPSSDEHGLELVYVVDREWDLWLLDASVALETPDDFIGWLDRGRIAALISAVNKLGNDPL